MDGRDEQLLDEIVEFLNEPAVLPKAKKAIQQHGYDSVREEFGEMRATVQTRAETDDPIKNPPGYFIGLLKILDDRSQPKKPNQPTGRSVFYESLEEHLNSMLATTVAKEDIIEFNGSMVAPYSGQGVPWPTGLGPEFFTLSTNKKKSDSVKTTIRLANGRSVLVPMVRGKAFLNAEERGIMTAEDNRIIKAMVIIWAQDGCQHTTGKTMWCYAKFTMRRLARTMGYTNFGGRDLVRLSNRLERLGTISYYIDLSDSSGFEKLERKTYTINFVDKPVFIDTTVDGHREISVRVTFSDFLSSMFIRRKTVTRSKDLVLQKNELALLIQEYIEARVSTENEKDGFRIYLSTLIERLHLPKAKWHAYRSKRCEKLAPAIKELNGSSTWDGDAFFASIDENVGGSDALLRVKRVNIIDSPELPFSENTHTPKSQRYLIARERAVKAYVGKFERGMGNLAYALRQYAALRLATDPQ